MREWWSLHLEVFFGIIPFVQVAGGVEEWSSGLEVGDGISVSWTVVCIIIPLAQVNGGWMGEGLWIG